MKKTLLITEYVRFIGFHLNKKLIKKYDIIVIDNISNYYLVKLKNDKLTILKKYKNFIFYKIDLSKKNTLKILSYIKVFKSIYLVTQVGVRNFLYKSLKCMNDKIISQINLYL